MRSEKKQPECNKKPRYSSPDENELSSLSRILGSNLKLSVSAGSEKDAKIVKIAKTFPAPGLLISKDTEQALYLGELLDDSGVKCSVFTAESGLEDNRQSLENITSGSVKIFITDESSAENLPKNLKFRFIINETMPVSLFVFAAAMINNLDVSGESFHFTLFDPRDRFFREELLKINHPDNCEDFKKAIISLGHVEDYCFRMGCRIGFLRIHFFENREYSDCGRCDNCRRNARSLSVSADEDEKTRIVLECITEMREKFGMHTIADTLRGMKSKNIRSYRLYRSKAFGVLYKTPKKEIIELINILLEKNILNRTKGTFPTLYITPSGRRLIDYSGIVQLELPKRMALHPGERINFALIERLRNFRRERARELNLPAFKVFSDRILKEIAAEKPVSEKKLTNIKGFGKNTWNICGRALLKLLEANDC
ncbi:RQC domain-containing protein [candidate division KSB1 bacterium]